jgi:hypothetical protein
VEEVAAKLVKVDRTTELFQTMAIVSLNMGNLTLEVNTLENRLVTKEEEEKALLQEELDKEKKFQNGYKHNVEIWRKTGQRLSKKIKYSLKNYKMRMRSSRVAQHS